MSSLEEKILKTWHLRVNFETESCLRFFSELKRDLSVPSQPLDSVLLEKLLDRPEAAQILDVLALQASLTHTLGNFPQGESLLVSLEREALKRGIADNFYLCYERGRFAFQRGDYSQAMESFLRTSLLAKCDLQRLWGTINTLFCLENLGLPFGSTWDEVSRLVKELENQHHLDTVKRQLLSLSVRELFREGRVKKALSREDNRAADNSDQRTDQGKYLALWLKSLPYHAAFRPPAPEELTSLSVGPVSLLFKGYRLRTLQGVLHPEDQGITKPSERIDRMYLWIWRWMQNPQGFPAQKISMLFRDTCLAEFSYRLTWEDTQLLRNALLWLAFFDPHSERRLKNFLGGLSSHTSADYAVFRLEYLTIQYLFSLREKNTVVAKDYLVALQTHPLWGSSEVHFNRIVESVSGEVATAPKALQRLAENLRTLIYQDPVSRNGVLTIDPNRSHVQSAGSSEKIVSEALARGFELLYSKRAVSCEELVSVCFGLRQYDPLIHNPKIFNLLSRMKRLAEPSLTFHMRQGQILSKGDWEGIRFVNGMEVPELFRALAEETSSRFQSAPATRDSRSLQSPPHWEGMIARRDLEAKIRRPRSTTNRILAQWLEQGVVRRSGTARNTKYFLPAGSRHADRSFGGNHG